MKCPKCKEIIVNSKLNLCPNCGYEPPFSFADMNAVALSTRNGAKYDIKQLEQQFGKNKISMLITYKYFYKIENKVVANDILKDFWK